VVTGGVALPRDTAFDGKAFGGVGVVPEHPSDDERWRHLKNPYRSPPCYEVKVSLPAADGSGENGFGSSELMFADVPTADAAKAIARDLVRSLITQAATAGIVVFRDGEVSVAMMAPGEKDA
jgi:hypothetical protein